MKRKIKGLFFCLILVVIFCAACMSDKGSDVQTDNSDNTDNTSSEAASVGEQDMAELDEDMLSVYAGYEYGIDFAADELFYNFSMGSDALYYTVMRQEQDIWKNYLYRIGYSDIVSLTDANVDIYGMIAEPVNSIDEVIECIYVQDDELEGWDIEKLYAYGDGVYVLGIKYGGQKDTQLRHGICKIDSKGNVSDKLDITEVYNELTDSWAYGEKRICDDFYIINDENNETEYVLMNFNDGVSRLAVIDREGKLVLEKKYDYLIGSAYVTQEGRLRYSYTDQGGGQNRACMHIDELTMADTDESVMKISGIGGIPQIFALDKIALDSALNADFGVVDRRGVYFCDEDKGKCSQIIKWSDMDIESIPGWICYPCDDGHIIAMYIKRNEDRTELYIDSFVRSQNNYDAERRELVIGVNYTSDELERMVRLFNSTNDAYRAVIKEYGYGEEVTQRLGTELISGKGPDLLDTILFDADEYVRSDMVENLNDYLDGSDILSREDFISTVLDAYTVDGCLFTIPRSFSISVYAGLTDIVGEGAGWTNDEFIQVIKQNEGCDIGGFASPTLSAGEYMVEMLWRGNKEKYVDWDTFTADFLNDEFIDILSYVAAYEVTQADTRLLTLETFENKRNVIYDTHIGSLGDIVKVKNILGGDMALKGYPSSDGEAAYRIMDMESYAISAMSNEKEGAWEFIEFALSFMESMNGKRMSEFPSRKDFLNRVIERDMSNRNIDLEKTPYLAVGEADRQELIDMLRHIRYNSTDNIVIENIIIEEVFAMLQGQNTPEQTAKLIQDRVQLYLDEKV